MSIRAGLLLLLFGVGLSLPAHGAKTPDADQARLTQLLVSLNAEVTARFDAMRAVATRSKISCATFCSRITALWKTHRVELRRAFKNLREVRSRLPIAQQEAAEARAFEASEEQLTAKTKRYLAALPKLRRWRSRCRKPARRAVSYVNALGKAGFIVGD